MDGRVHGTREMIAGMEPKLVDGTFVFCTSTDLDTITAALLIARGMFVEDEGISFLLSEKEARELGFEPSLPMRQITLCVPSALDGVGLTAAVATELAEAGIPCNVVAANYHDHIFIPEGQAADALDALQALQQRFANS